MAMFKRIFKKFLGFEEDELEEEKEYEETNVKNNLKQPTNQKPNTIRNVYQEQEIRPEIKKTKEIVLYPKTFGDACEVVEHVEQGYMVIVNMDDVDIDTCKRIADFVLGAIYVLQGDVEKISKKVFRFWITK